MSVGELHLPGQRIGPLASGALTRTAAVQVYLLGSFRVVVHGRTLGADAWPRRRARQLFKCLLSRPQRRLSKDEAIELLWPEGDPSAGAASLRSTLTVLRQALEPSELITADRDSIGLRPSPDLWVDADAFEEALARSRTPADPLPLLEE